MKQIAKDGGATIDNSQLQQVEQAIGRALPRAYKDFLLQSNGGKPLFPLFMANGFIRQIHDFMRIEEGSMHDLLRTGKAVDDAVNAGAFVPIASTTFGDMVCIHLATGAVYFWQHDQVHGTGADGYDRMDFLAKNFEAFADMLCAEESRETRDRVHRLGKTGCRAELSVALANNDSLVTEDGYSVGEIAAMHGNLELLDEWLKGGHPPGRSLHIAAMNGRFLIIDHLIALGFDINQIDIKGITPLDAASWDEEYKKELRHRGAKPARELH